MNQCLADSPEPRRLDALELAMLHGGPPLAVTIAAARLHRMGALTVDAAGNRVGPAPAPSYDDDDVSDLELELYHAVRRAPGIAADSLCDRVEQGTAVERMIAELTASGLLSKQGRRRRTSGSSTVTHTFTGGRRWATREGEALLCAQRDPRHRRVRPPDLLLPVALRGGDMLWAVDPILAAAWAITREPVSPRPSPTAWVWRAISAAGLLALLAALDFSLPLAAWVAFGGFAGALLLDPREFLAFFLAIFSGDDGALTEGYSKHLRRNRD